MIKPNILHLCTGVLNRRWQRW